VGMGIVIINIVVVIVMLLLLDNEKYCYSWGRGYMKRISRLNDDLLPSCVEDDGGCCSMCLAVEEVDDCLGKVV